MYDYLTSQAEYDVLTSNFISSQNIVMQRWCYPVFLLIPKSIFYVSELDFSDPSINNSYLNPWQEHFSISVRVNFHPVNL